MCPCTPSLHRSGADEPRHRQGCGVGTLSTTGLPLASSSQPSHPPSTPIRACGPAWPWMGSGVRWPPQVGPVLESWVQGVHAIAWRACRSGTRERGTSGRWRQSAPLLCSAGVSYASLLAPVAVFPAVYSTTPLSSPVHAYWITSVAWKRSLGGMVRSSAFAVCKLMTSSNRMGRSTGRSPGLLPLRILSTKVAARRQLSGTLGP